MAYETLEKHEQLFFEAVGKIRRGENFMDCVNSLELRCDAAGIGAMTLCAEARQYSEELQCEAFNAAVEAFRQRQTRAEIEDKLIRRLSFHPWDALLLAGRAAERATREEQK